MNEGWGDFVYILLYIVSDVTYNIRALNGVKVKSESTWGPNIIRIEHSVQPYS